MWGLAWPCHPPSRPPRWAIPGGAILLLLTIGRTPILRRRRSTAWIKLYWGHAQWCRGLRCWQPPCALDRDARSLRLARFARPPSVPRWAPVAGRRDEPSRYDGARRLADRVAPVRGSTSSRAPGCRFSRPSPRVTASGPLLPDPAARPSSPPRPPRVQPRGVTWAESSSSSSNRMAPELMTSGVRCGPGASRWASR